jgi:hypothetical protein
MKKLLIILIVVVLVAIGSYFTFFNGNDVPLSENSQMVVGGSVYAQPGNPVTYDNIASQLSNNAIIKDLPDDMGIMFRFYSFEGGSRVWGKSYILKPSGAHEGYLADADLIIYLDSKYLSSWTDRNFCSVVSTANRNGDLGYESSLSEIKLAWKFRSLMKHKSCFGF